METGDGAIIQINATIITGVLILLTISSFDPNSQSKPYFLNVIGIYDATAIIIAPFAASAICAAHLVWYRESFSNYDILKKLRENKINRLRDTLAKIDNIYRSKVEEDILKLEKKLRRTNRHIAKYDEEEFQSHCIKIRVWSIATMIIGFCYLILIILGIAFS